MKEPITSRELQHIASKAWQCQWLLSAFEVCGFVAEEPITSSCLVSLTEVSMRKSESIRRYREGRLCSFEGGKRTTHLCRRKVEATRFLARFFIIGGRSPAYRSSPFGRAVLACNGSP
jgi:hypothetical protein